MYISKSLTTSYITYYVELLTGEIVQKAIKLQKRNGRIISQSKDQFTITLRCLFLQFTLLRNDLII